MPTLRIPATLEHLAKVNEYVDATVPALFLPAVAHIKLAAEELLVNIFSYAYQSTTGVAEVECVESKLEGRPCLLLRIRDWGPPFNPFAQAQAPDIFLDIDARPIGGLGIHLLTVLSAAQRYTRENNSNLVELFFFPSGQSDSGPGDSEKNAGTKIAAPLLLALFFFLAAAQTVSAASAILYDDRATNLRRPQRVGTRPMLPARTQATLPAGKAAAFRQSLPAESAHAPSLPEGAPSVPVTENLLHGMDVYALSPYARFLTALPAQKLPLASPPDAQARLSGEWSPFIHEASLRHGVPAALIAAVIRTESGCNPLAVSPKGAQGLMQLMPATQQQLGVTNPYDPRSNILAGSQYLRMQLDTFGSLDLALAAYNAGPSNVLRYKGVPPFMETRHFVNKVLSLIEGR